MQTQLADFVRDTPAGQEAESILRKCVHCGFCSATCPTYQLLGDELDSPRGRIYQIKQVLEGAEATRTTQLHLDRCLTCLNCETTCPSGVRYGRLVDIGRELVESRVSRPVWQSWPRNLLCAVLPYERRFAALMRLARLVRPVLPGGLRRKVMRRSNADLAWPVVQSGRSMLLLRGCVQPVLAPQINAAAARVLDRLGIRLTEVPGVGCCGAVQHHTSATAAALDRVRRNVDTWWPLLRDGAEALVVTASGCGAMIKQYGELLANDPDYADKARAVADKTRDLAEIVAAEDLGRLGSAREAATVACHVPCTLQHAQQLPSSVAGILDSLGFELAPVGDSHLCCGSAGTYSLLQADLSERLRERKLKSLTAAAPATIVTANIGCLQQLQNNDVPVMHWIELVDTCR